MPLLSDIIFNGNVNPQDIPAMRAAMRATATQWGALAPATQLGKVVNAAGYGVVADGLTDDTAALKKAIAAAESAAGPTPIVLPRGVIKLSDTLSFGPNSGSRFGGVGSLVDSLPGWYAVSRGTVLKWAGPNDRPMIDYFGTGGFSLGDVALDGAGVAQFGVRLRGKTDWAGGGGLVRNVGIFGCDVGWNCGDSDNGILASDMTYEGLTVSGCRIGFQTSHTQALNHVFIRPTFVSITESCFDLVASNITVLGGATYNVNRVTKIQGGGINYGDVTFVNLRMDGDATYRTIVHEIDAGAGGGSSRATYIAPHRNDGQKHDTSDAAAAFILKDSHVCRVIGGDGLCGPVGGGTDQGRLLTMTNGIFTCEGMCIPSDTTKILGTISGGHYKFLHCIDYATHDAFVADFSA